jgi:diguanylate cyclase (GGDEF)-like protein
VRENTEVLALVIEMALASRPDSASAAWPKSFTAGLSLEGLSSAALDSLKQAIIVLNLQAETMSRNQAFKALFGEPDDLAMFHLAVGNMAAGTDAAETILAIGEKKLFVSRIPISGGCVVTIDDLSVRLAEQARIAEEARTDSLTLLGNRLMLREKLAEILAKRRDEETPAVLAIDLDRFKAVNDSLGHHIGDILLRAVADRIGSALGTADLAARFGGDEFCVVQIGQSQPNAAATLAKRLVDLLGRSYLLDGHLINIGASVGIALCPMDGAEDNVILKNADLALYRAKQDGRGKFCFFETAMSDEMQTRRNLEIDLRRALALREFSLVFQPQYNLKSRQITGFEALLRWNSVSRGVVSPAQFIPLAEETGLIVSIGEWVMRTACKEAASWAEPLDVSVNVSAVQFGKPGLTAMVISALAESGLDPRRLELEVTESVLIGDHKSALEVLRSVRELGVRVSMDDFGTGYSSLSYLRSFPFDKIKIDQSFVRSSLDDPSGVAIVRAIAALGKSLGMTTTAEGVETEEQLARILADGCTDVQGYLISKPLPPDKITDFLQSHRETAQAGPGDRAWSFQKGDAV